MRKLPTATTSYSRWRRCSAPSRGSAFFCAVFFFNSTAPREIYTLSLHDALPIASCVTSSPRSSKVSRTPSKSSNGKSSTKRWSRSLTAAKTCSTSSRALPSRWPEPGGPTGHERSRPAGSLHHRRRPRLRLHQRIPRRREFHRHCRLDARAHAHAGRRLGRLLQLRRRLWLRCSGRQDGGEGCSRVRGGGPVGHSGRPHGRHHVEPHHLVLRQ